MNIRNAANQFLRLKTIAVAGVSSKGDAASNIIYKKLREHDYHVYPVNPNADEVEGDPCFPNLKSIPEKVEGVIVGTAPEVTPEILSECAEMQIRFVWIHRSFGQGSFHPEAEKIASQHKISLIPGGCPMMFLEPVDPAHKCMRWFLKVTGTEAKPVGFHT